MPQLKPTIIPTKVLKDNTHKIRIALYHKGETRYIVTDLALDSPTQLRGGLVVKHPNAKYLNLRLSTLMRKFQEILDGIEYTNALSCGQIYKLLNVGSASTYRTIESVYDEYVKLNDMSEGTRRTYQVAFQSLSKNIKPDTLLASLTTSTILTLDRKLKLKSLSKSTIRNYMNFLRVLVNYAIRSGYVEYKIHPFATYQVPKVDVRDVWLTVEDIKAIRDCKPLTAVSRYCRDLFMLSYYLGGMNFADIMDANFSSRHLKYKRKKIANKTTQFVEFDMPDEAMAIIKRITGRNGKINTKFGKFSVNSDLFYHNMPSLAADADLNKRVIFYSARKSFAQHAFDLGVDTTIIDYVLGHSLNPSKSSLFHYLTVKPDMATNAIRTVLDNLK